MRDGSRLRIACRASPSLALVKYWGKREGGLNIPATPSLALTLGGLETRTVVAVSREGADRVTVDGKLCDIDRFEPFFAELRTRLGSQLRFDVESRNSFPGGAGFASSSSGFAALALACSRLISEIETRPGADTPSLSELARCGSASAARAVFGGFTILGAGALHAEPFLPEGHWPDLRVVAAVVARGPKPHSSRSAMAATRETSPYYDKWLSDAPLLFARAREALERRDLVALGETMRLSYSRMHASALAADPPLLYWLPASVALIGACAGLRARGVGAWETMDAGPQVKVLCLEKDLDAVRDALGEAVPGIELIVAHPGPGPQILVLDDSPGPAEFPGMSFALTVPANLLLLGEYAVTEEGGLGIALAAAPRLRLSLSPHTGRGLAIGGRMGPNSFNWVEGESDPPPLVAACLAEARGALVSLANPSIETVPARPSTQPRARESDVPSLASARIDIDSSAFFSADGAKRGFGSSAAVAVGLCAALLRLGGLEGEALEAAIFPVALAAHRRAQGGRGSGYDVAASRFGGAGLFKGGASPSWARLSAATLAALRSLELRLRLGAHPVSSAASVGAYQRWKSKDAPAHRAFFSASAGYVRNFIAGRSPERLLAVLREAGTAGAALGDIIGVPARPGESLGQPSPVEKCLGAGDELVLVAWPRMPGSSASPTASSDDKLDVSIESEGLRWE